MQLHPEPQFKRAPGGRSLSAADGASPARSTVGGSEVLPVWGALGRCRRPPSPHDPATEVLLPSLPTGDKWGSEGEQSPQGYFRGALELDLEPGSDTLPLSFSLTFSHLVHSYL